MTVSVTSGTCSSPSFRVRQGVTTNPSGIFVFPSKDEVVGIALRVERWYEKCALACGEGDRDAFGGSLISGGGRSSSRGSGGDVSRFVVYNDTGFCPPPTAMLLN